MDVLAPVYQKPIPLPFPIVQIEASALGYNILWTVFVLMLLATGVFVVLALRVNKAMRLFHYITAMITLTAAVSYYAMATRGGVSFIRTGKDQYRQLFYARYIDWSVTTPLLLLDLCLLAGTPGIDMVALIFADLGMILTGLFASFETHSTYSWGWYTIACLFYLYIVYGLLLNGRSSAAARGQKVAKLFDSVAGLTLVLWTLYPVVWGLSEGSGLLDLDQEIAFYAVLDVLAKGIFGLWLLTGHMNIPESAVPLEGFWLFGVATGQNSGDLA